jgi:hypothetical protein
MMKLNEKSINGNLSPGHGINIGFGVSYYR